MAAGKGHVSVAGPQLGMRCGAATRQWGVWRRRRGSWPAEEDRPVRQGEGHCPVRAPGAAPRCSQCCTRRSTRSTSSTRKGLQMKAAKPAAAHLGSCICGTGRRGGGQKEGGHKEGGQCACMARSQCACMARSPCAHSNATAPPASMAPGRRDSTTDLQGVCRQRNHHGRVVGRQRLVQPPGRLDAVHLCSARGGGCGPIGQQLVHAQGAQQSRRPPC